MVGFRFAATILILIAILVAAKAKEHERKYDHIDEEHQKELMAAGMKEAEREYDHNKLEEPQPERRAAGDLTGQ